MVCFTTGLVMCISSSFCALLLSFCTHHMRCSVLILVLFLVFFYRLATDQRERRYDSLWNALTELVD